MMNFSDKIKIAFTKDRLDYVREAYLLRQTGMLTDNWNIYLNVSKTVGLDIELLERVVRFMTKFNYCMENTSLVFTVENCHKDLKEYIKWFILFFSYLEGAELFDIGAINSENKSIHVKNKDHEKVFSSKYIPYPFDYDNVHFVHSKIEIVFI